MILTPNRADLATYLDMLFGYVEAGEENHAYCIALRGLGEKGTDGEGKFSEVEIVPPIRSGMEVDLIFGHVQRWSAHGRASFIVPAAVAAAALSDGKATESRIQQFTTLVVDIDTGDTNAKLAHAVRYLGQASMVVYSGGITEADAPKLHAYWRFSEASSDVERVAVTRKLLALKVGGDAAFGRSTQVIRVPGSIYGKNGEPRPCFIYSKSTAEHEPEDLFGIVGEMPTMEGLVVPPEKLNGGMTPTLYAMSGGLNFSSFKAAKGDLADEKPDIAESLNSDIAEGGDVDRNRWGEFSRVAGLHIHQARQNIITLEKAAELTMTWAEVHMKPVWPVERFNREWRGLLEADVRNNGPLVKLVEPAPQVLLNPNTTPGIPMIRKLDGSWEPQPLLTDWSVDKLTQGEAPKRKFLVDGLIMAGKPHLLASEGGAGKTFLMMDLGVKIAAHRPGMLQSWCGLPLAGDAGGTVVIFTTEDDKEELHIRIAETFPPDVAKRVGERLIIFPTINTGGAFAMVERDRAQGPARYGQRWEIYLNQLRKLTNLKAVIIDTLNTTLHGEENSATVINEYVQAVASPICGEMGAAVVVTHHVRKPAANQKIWTPEDMKSSIRGSSALIGGFRAVLGIWHAPDYQSRLAALGREAVPGQLYNFAVVKANNPEMAYGVRSLLREKSGLLVDITDQEAAMVAGKAGEMGAWLVQAVAYAAEQEQPFTVKALCKLPPNGRKTQLPAILRDLSERRMLELAKEMIDAGRIKQCNPKGNKTFNHLDVPGGPLAMAMGSDGGSYTIAPGQDFDPPDWEKVFAYHAVEGRIVKRGEEKKRTYQGAKNEPVEEPISTPFNPNIQFGIPLNERLHPTGCTPTQNDGATGATGLQFSRDYEKEIKDL